MCCFEVQSSKSKARGLTSHAGRGAAELAEDVEDERVAVDHLRQVTRQPCPLAALDPHLLGDVRQHQGAPPLQAVLWFLHKVQKLGFKLNPNRMEDCMCCLETPTLY